jgi:hypothetical protein
MVAVLRSWDPEATDDKLSPPPGLSFGIGEQVIVLGRQRVLYTTATAHLDHEARVRVSAFHRHPGRPRGRGQSAGRAA